MLTLAILVAIGAALATPAYLAARCRPLWIGRLTFWLEAAPAAALLGLTIWDYLDFEAATAKESFRDGTPLFGIIVFGLVAIVWAVGLVVFFVLGRKARRRRLADLR